MFNKFSSLIPIADYDRQTNSKKAAVKIEKKDALYTVEKVGSQKFVQCSEILNLTQTCTPCNDKELLISKNCCKLGWRDNLLLLKYKLIMIIFSHCIGLELMRFIQKPLHSVSSQKAANHCTLLNTF